MQKIERMKELIPVLNEAGRAYYRESREIMSNREYDALYDELVRLEQETGVVLSDSPTVKVGYETVSNLPKKAHPVPMLSQNKTKSVEELQSFLGSQTGLLSWKMDGLTVVLTYEGGEMLEAVTRGDGRIGAIVTANARAFRNIPRQIAFRGRLVLRGEAVITYPDFEEINRLLPESEAQYKNPRNLCSGSVLQLNSQVTAERRVRFYAFALVEAEGMTFTLHSEELAWLSEEGFEVVPFKSLRQEELPAGVLEFKNAVASNPIPSDGLVLLMDDIAYGRSLGTTAKYPRDSIAFKWEDETARTHLTGIEWSASRTGLINPVALFEPVELEGTTVSRASVHNLSIMEGLALGEGDEISVYKANMIIPQIGENFTRSGTVRPPVFCPVCGAPTEIRDTGEARTLYCSNPACPAKQLKSFELFVSRNAINIEGLSEATLEEFLSAGIVKSYADLFRLAEHRDQIVTREGFGEKSWQKLCDAAEKARHTTLTRLLAALGISQVGTATARLLSRYFRDDIEALRQASEEELCQIEGIGDVTAAGIRAWFSDAENARQLDELLTVLEMEKTEDSGTEQDLDGLTFVITGSLTHFPNRDALKTEIEKRGGKVSGSVSAKTTALINNDAASNSTKNKTAQKFGVPVLTEDEFLQKYSFEA
ncbi:MAG: NAD-dependent DNA ligase LigA [Lachnospiraceae bacterium]|nr:NAD-dependent DNA ligase LigA [Lachnospiraceae bacterium]